MIVIDKAPSFTAEVTIRAPGGAALVLPLKFAALGRRGYAAWTSGAVNKTSLGAQKTEGEWLAEVVLGWVEGSEPKNEKGEIVPFGVDALEALCDTYFTAGRAIATTYTAELAGAREGN
jgi:hypothetical protein